MPNLGLFFVGPVLLINGLSLLGRVDAKAAAPVNAFTGVLLIGVTLYIDLPAAARGAGASSVVLGSAGYLLFAFTYLYVAVGNWSGASGSGLGWYCGWATLVAVFLSAEYYATYHDAKFGTIWLSWALLFATFFTVLALKVSSLTAAAGWLTVLEAFSTCTIPGALLLAGRWNGLSTGIVIAAQAAVAVAFLAVAWRSPRHADPLSDDPPDRAAQAASGSAAVSG